ncbi:duf1665 domain containing protein [Ophiocordyceps camponoti-floridani]|uniref:Duf1665 domain containing protein n=1 Tax=Ophiocordyceps camponoti-floridani TaxID=2030778 RepID=A0A8H4Q7A1_9HYPO|nr:duf1665 domain containing protein [Ophiocordyceps camponoti-floridani]
MATPDQLRVPGLGLPADYFPGEGQHFPMLFGSEDRDWAAVTLTLREMCMLKFVEEISNKPEWWIKVFDPEISGRWKAEALGMKWNEYRQYADFTPAMADACITELRHKAEMYEKTGLMPVFDYSACVIKSDRIVSPSLWQDLRDVVAPLENIPEDRKDWHPGSDGKVLNLVHPSLYPLVYGRTRILPDKRIGVDDALDRCSQGEVIDVPELVRDTQFISRKFQWLPCDVLIDRRHARIETYVNNLHPQRHAAVYPVLERFIEAALPAWDIVYRWPWEFGMQRLKATEARTRCRAPNSCLRNKWGTVACNPFARPIRSDEPPRRNYRDDPFYDDWDIDRDEDSDIAYESEVEEIKPNRQYEGGDDNGGEDGGDEDEGDEDEGDEDDSYNSDDDGVHHISYDERKRRDISWFLKTHPMKLPDCKPDENKVKIQASDVNLIAPMLRLPTDTTATKEGVSAGKRRIQVIVKLANIQLDPSKPSYNGGSWHLEGQLNERICATALFYYDSHNVTDASLEFRTTANADDLDGFSGYQGGIQHEQYDTHSIARVFGINTDLRDTTQKIGGVLTRHERALFFPNIYQHRVSPFRLADDTKPGHRKILALFLVDPAVPIISTANVPPQQGDWGQDAQCRQVQILTGQLPQEVLDMVREDMDRPAISEEEAKRYREKLMKERTRRQAHASDRLTLTAWNFCEH